MLRGAPLDAVVPERDGIGPDESVVARVLEGNVELFEVIMRRHNSRMYRVARSILGEDDEAEDVVQDAYVRAYAHLAEFRGDAAFSTWLTRIVVHEALARLRRRQRCSSLEDEVRGALGEEIMVDRDRTPERHAYDGELRAVLEGAIDALPLGFRTVFVMRVLEDMSAQAIANALGIPEDTVRTRLHRARLLLQRELLERLETTAREAFAFDGGRCDRVVEAVLRRIRATQVA